MSVFLLEAMSHSWKHHISTPDLVRNSKFTYVNPSVYMHANPCVYSVPNICLGFFLHAYDKKFLCPPFVINLPQMRVDAASLLRDKATTVLFAFILQYVLFHSLNRI